MYSFTKQKLKCYKTEFLECPDIIRVTNKNLPFINGVYSITSQIRRQRPVWYNNEKNKFVFVSVNKKWHIANSEEYNLDTDISWAFANFGNGKASCPQNLDYKLWLNNKWTEGTDLSVIAGMHDFWFSVF